MPHDLARLVPAHRAIVEQLQAMFPAEDLESLGDTIAGCSDLPSALATVLRNAMEREAYGKAVAEMIETLTARKRRLEEGAKSMRLAVMEAMQTAGIPKLNEPDFSASIGRGKPKVVITEPTLIPDELCRIVREPNKIEIGKALSDGADVPGACLGNSPSFLSIHRR